MIVSNRGFRVCILENKGILNTCRVYTTRKAALRVAKRNARKLVFIDHTQRPAFKINGAERGN